MREPRTAPAVYGSLEVVCWLCGKANQVLVDSPAGEFGGGYQWEVLACSECGERAMVEVRVERR